AFYRIDNAQLPLNAQKRAELRGLRRVDSTGVYRYDESGKEVTHPVAQAQHTLKALVNHTGFSEAGALDIAVANGLRILDSVVEEGGAYYYPYSEPFKVH